MNIVIWHDCEIILTLKSRTRIKDCYVTHDIMYHNLSPQFASTSVWNFSISSFTPLNKTCSIKPGYRKWETVTGSTERLALTSDASTLTWLLQFCLWKMKERSLCPKKNVVPFSGLQAKNLLTSKNHLKLKHWLNEFQSYSSEYTFLSIKMCKNLFQTIGSINRFLYKGGVYVTDKF